MLEKETESDPRKMSSHARSAWRGKELAEFMLEVLGLVESETDGKSDTSTGFISIRDLAVRYEASGGIDKLNFGRLGASTRLSYDRRGKLQEPDFFSDYFKAIISNVGMTLFRVCELVYNGIPLFRKLEDGTYQQIEFSDADYIYLSKMGEHGGIPESWRLPYWVDEYFLDEEHIRAHRIFFSQAEPPTPAQVVPLKAAFRAHIGCAQVTALALQVNLGTSSPSRGRTKPESTRELNTSRRILGAMLADKYTEEAKQPYKLAEALVTVLDMHGQSVSKQTIADHIRAATKALENGSSEAN